MSTPKITTTKAKYEDGTVIEDKFIVLADGAEVGKLTQHPGTPRGYWGRWSVWLPHRPKFITDTKRDALVWVAAKLDEDRAKQAWPTGA